MAGDQQLHALAQDQLIAHAFAVAVAGIHQGLQQVVAGLLVAALLDVVHQNAVGAGAHLFVFAQFAGDGKPGIHVGLKGLPNDEFLDGADGVADEVDVFVFQLGAEQRPGDHGEGHFHQVGVNIDGAGTGLSFEIPQRLGERVLHDRGESLELFSIETLLDQAPLSAPGFTVGGEKAFAQEVAHPLYLNFRFLVVLRVGLQYVLNDVGIGGDDGLFKAAYIEPECVAEEFGVLCQDLHGIADHGGRVRKGTKSGNDGYRRGQRYTSPGCVPLTVENLMWSA